MVTLKDLIEQRRQPENLSIEKMARVVDISRNQFATVMDTGFIDRTTLKTIRGFATLLNMEAWELLKVLDEPN
jgi:hypothetical protein